MLAWRVLYAHTINKTSSPKNAACQILGVRAALRSIFNVAVAAVFLRHKRPTRRRTPPSPPQGYINDPGNFWVLGLLALKI